MALVTFGARQKISPNVDKSDKPPCPNRGVVLCTMVVRKGIFFERKRETQAFWVSSGAGALSAAKTRPTVFHDTELKMHIDWLTFSLDFAGDVHKTLPQHEIFALKRRVKPNGRYGKAWVTESGAIFSIPKDGEWTQKALIEIQGKHAQKIRDMGVSDDNLIFETLAHGGKITRLDCAFDTNLPSANPLDLWQAWLAGEIVTKVREARITSSADRKGTPASSVYFGGTQSEQKLVVYDKAKQMKLLNEAWTRVEVRLYGDTARRAARDMLANDADSVARQKVRNMMKTRVKWFEDMVAGGDVAMEKRIDVPKKLQWLNNQVAPAIDSIPLENPDIVEDVAWWLIGRLNTIAPGWLGHIGLENGDDILSGIFTQTKLPGYDID